MIQRLMTKWWWLGLCVAFEAAVSIFYFNHAAYGVHSSNAVVLLGKLTLAAGVCTIAAGALMTTEGKRWLLVFNGLCCSSLGLYLTFWTRSAFRTMALLIVLMATSLGTYELATAGRLRRQHALEWLAGAAGIVSLGFAAVFLAFLFRWIKLKPASPAQTFFWLGSYFGFSALCMLGTARLPLGHAKSRSSAT
jgi:uncharacterized membrane protein HdeD (DUF308 family)